MNLAALNTEPSGGWNTSYSQTELELSIEQSPLLFLSVYCMPKDT